MPSLSVKTPISSNNMASQMFTGSSNFTISGGNFVNQGHLQTSALDKLSAATTHSALHDAPARTDESRCHQHTRTNVLDKLERWAQGICDEGQSVVWLYGGAGAGKSAIMQTLAERCVSQRLTLGSFFFSRSDPTRSTAEFLIPTLAYQLAQLFPAALQVVEPIIDRDPLIFKKSLQVQLVSLFVRPLQHLVQLGIISDAPQTPRVLLIDGLDECGDTTQQQTIIEVVAAVCHEYRIPIKFLIASRPEHAISASFQWYKQANRVLGTISLSKDADAEEDIRRFIDEEFLKIRTRHPFNYMIPSKWPRLYDINRLVWKSSCHFIYASTAMKYIWSTKENPVRSLQVVLGLEVSRTISPFSELDALYHHILGSATHRDKVLEVLAHRLFTNLSPSVGMVCMMLDCSKDDLAIFMADMTPLAAFSKPSFGHEEEVTLLHASLEDFLRDLSRSGSLYVNKEVYLASKLERCFQLFDLCSRRQRTAPNWLTNLDNNPYMYYAQLKDEILTIIEVSGHLLATEEALKRYSLHAFYQCQLRFKQDYQQMSDFLGDLCKFLVVVHLMKTPNAVRLFERFMEDFFDILESSVALESMPLAPATVTLAFSGYPTQVVRRILRDHFIGKPFFWLLSYEMHNYVSDKFKTVLDIVAMAAPASVHHTTNTSPKRLAVAAEAILEYLIDEVNLQFLSTCSVHKSWLQRAKPGKHIATGAPRLASGFRTLCLSKLRLWEDPGYIHVFRASHNYTPRGFDFGRLCMVLGSKYGHISDALERRRRKVPMIVDLLEALLWLLPKAGFSDKIALYSKRMFPRSMYQRKPVLIRRVRKCLDRYTTRVRNAKLEELRHRIENGDVNALIEESHMLYLDAQD